MSEHQTTNNIQEALLAQMKKQGEKQAADGADVESDLGKAEIALQTAAHYENVAGKAGQMLLAAFWHIESNKLYTLAGHEALIDWINSAAGRFSNVFYARDMAYIVSRVLVYVDLKKPVVGGKAITADDLLAANGFASRIKAASKHFDAQALAGNHDNCAEILDAAMSGTQSQVNAIRTKQQEKSIPKEHIINGQQINNADGTTTVTMILTPEQYQLLTRMLGTALNLSMVTAVH